MKALIPERSPQLFVAVHIGDMIWLSRHNARDDIIEATAIFVIVEHIVRDIVLPSDGYVEHPTNVGGDVLSVLKLLFILFIVLFLFYFCNLVLFFHVQIVFYFMGKFWNQTKTVILNSVYRNKSSWIDLMGLL